MGKSWSHSFTGEYVFEIEENTSMEGNPLILRVYKLVKEVEIQK